MTSTTAPSCSFVGPILTQFCRSYTYAGKRAVRYLALLAISAEVRGYCPIAPDGWVTMIKHEKKTMAFRQFTKFVADLNPGHCGLGAEGSNMRRLEATPCSFTFRLSRK
jgi:hypothetical protein